MPKLTLTVNTLAWTQAANAHKANVLQQRLDLYKKWQQTPSSMLMLEQLQQEIDHLKLPSL